MRLNKQENWKDCSCFCCLWDIYLIELPMTFIGLYLSTNASLSSPQFDIYTSTLNSNDVTHECRRWWTPIHGGIGVCL